MTRNMICIGCPMGCELTVEVEGGRAISVSGNTCGIGKKYAETEVAAPTRMVTTTVSSAGGAPVPVKTRTAVPKDRIFDVVRAVKALTVPLPVAMGEVILEDAAGTGVPVIATRAVPS